MPIVPADSNSFVLPSTSELTLLLGPRHSDSKQENKKKPFHQPNRSCLAFERERARGSARHRRAAHVFKTKHSSSRCFCGSDAAPPPLPNEQAAPNEFRTVPHYSSSHCGFRGTAYRLLLLVLSPFSVRACSSSAARIITVSCARRTQQCPTQCTSDTPPADTSSSCGRK